MNKIVCFFLSLCTMQYAQSQNIGIGTYTPEFPLTVKADNNDIGIVQKGGTVEIGMVTNAVTGGWLKTLTNHNLNFATNNSTNPAMTISTGGNVGIGLDGTLPGYKLDVGGRIRFRHDETNNQTAGIWFDGITSSNRSFIGTINQNHFGIWGSGGAGWNIAMNVTNGNTGFGTSTPTAALDVAGNLRLRGNNIKAYSKIVSADVNGNANWTAPVAFRAQGSVNGNPTSISGNVWTKLWFNATTSYNEGLNYEPQTSQFVAPVKGIYHLSVQITWLNQKTASGVGFGCSRNNVPLNILPYQYEANGRVPDGNSFYSAIRTNIDNLSADVKLEAGDIVWVIVNRSSSDQVSPDISKTWFTGRLITTY